MEKEKRRKGARQPGTKRGKKVQGGSRERQENGRGKERDDGSEVATERQKRGWQGGEDGGR